MIDWAISTYYILQYYAEQLFCSAKCSLGGGSIHCDVNIGSGTLQGIPVVR